MLNCRDCYFLTLNKSAKPLFIFTVQSIENQFIMNKVLADIKITSPAIKHMENIPSKYTCDGENINPAIDIGNVPPETKSITLIMDDPDAPGKTWVHWVVWNIPAREHIVENSIPGIEGISDFQRFYYGGPCPPSGTHRYFFKVYALDILLDIPKNSRKRDVEKAMQGHTVGYGELIGMYKKKK